MNDSINFPYGSSSEAPIRLENLSFQAGINNGLLNEYITHNPAQAQPFINCSTTVYFTSTTAQNSNIMIFECHSPDNIHLEDMELFFVVKFKNTTQAAITIKTPLHLGFYMFKNFEIRMGSGGQKRTRLNNLQACMNLKKFMKYTAYDLKENSGNLGPKETSIPAGEEKTIDMVLPLWLFDTSGLIGIYKVYPSNTLLELTVETLKSPDAENFPAGITFQFESIFVTARVTKLKEELRTLDNTAMNLYGQIVSEVLIRGGITPDMDQILSGSSEYIATNLNKVNMQTLNHLPLVSVLSTPMHKYNTLEITNYFVQGPEVGANANAIFTTTIQSNTLMPKAIFFLCIWDNVPYDGAKGKRYPNTIEKIEVRINSQLAVNYPINYPSLIKNHTRKALNTRAHSGLTDEVFKDYFGIVGIVTDINGDLDHISEVRSGTIQAVVDIKNPHNSTKSYKMHIFRVYDQQIMINMAGVSEFVYNSL